MKPEVNGLPASGHALHQMPDSFETEENSPLFNQTGKAIKLTMCREHLPLVAWLPCLAAAAVPQNAHGCLRQ